MTKRENIRNHPIDAPGWWIEAATDASRLSGLIQAEIARRAARVMKVDDPPSVSSADA